MPYLVALIAATLAAWLVDGAVRPLVGSFGSMLLGTVAAAVAFFFAHRFLRELRG